MAIGAKSPRWCAVYGASVARLVYDMSSHATRIAGLTAGQWHSITQNAAATADLAEAAMERAHDDRGAEASRCL
ncbi:MAG: hypothetical protein ACHREM_01095 [Polyangiales bacterium]